MKQFVLIALALALCCISFGSMGTARAADKIKVLVVDGQNNHAWIATTPLIRAILENAGIFTVEVSTTPKDLAEWHPKFKDYGVVVSNYNGKDWPADVKKEFVDYVKHGGGFVAVHAANNSFSNWPEYNEMIGLGGWGGRNEKSGPYLRFREGKFVKDETPGAGGGHGKQHEFVIDVREPEHPIMKGLPLKWKHAIDELYHNLRGPANNVTVLGSAYSDKLQGGTGNDEPLLMAIAYDKGRVFHTALGHSVETMKGVGFQVTLARGTEWAATGKVTLPAPPVEDLPADKTVLRDPLKKP